MSGTGPETDAAVHDFMGFDRPPRRAVSINTGSERYGCPACDGQFRTTSDGKVRQRRSPPRGDARAGFDAELCLAGWMPALEKSMSDPEIRQRRAGSTMPGSCRLLRAQRSVAEG